MKTFKKQIKESLIISCLVFLLTSCNKENAKNHNGLGTVKSSPSSSNRSIADVVIPENANAEMIRVYNDIQNPDYEIAIIDNPQYGSFGFSPGYNIILSGKTRPSDEISVSLNDDIFSPSADGQWFLQNISLKSYIGRNVHVKINSGSTVLTESDIYVPKAHLASKLGEEGGAVIGRTGNNLTWTPDNNNVSGKIILFYHLYSDDGKTELDVDAELLDDDGSFSLDNIISNTNIKKLVHTDIRQYCFNDLQRQKNSFSHRYQRSP